jgi:hypothetical protein
VTPQQIELVQSSFKKAVPIAGSAADLFHDRLFEIAPEVRSMFPQDLSPGGEGSVGRDLHRAGWRHDRRLKRIHPAASCWLL